MSSSSRRKSKSKSRLLCTVETLPVSEQGTATSIKPVTSITCQQNWNKNLSHKYEGQKRKEALTFVPNFSCKGKRVRIRNPFTILQYQTLCSTESKEPTGTRTYVCLVYLHSLDTAASIHKDRHHLSCEGSKYTVKPVLQCQQ